MYILIGLVAHNWEITIVFIANEIPGFIGWKNLQNFMYVMVF